MRHSWNRSNFACPIFKHSSFCQAMRQLSRPVDEIVLGALRPSPIYHRSFGFQSVATTTKLAYSLDTTTAPEQPDISWGGLVNHGGANRTAADTTKHSQEKTQLSNNMIPRISLQNKTQIVFTRKLQYTLRPRNRGDTSTKSFPKGTHNVKRFLISTVLSYGCGLLAELKRGGGSSHTHWVVYPPQHSLESTFRSVVQRRRAQPHGRSMKDRAPSSESTMRSDVCIGSFLCGACAACRTRYLLRSSNTSPINQVSLLDPRCIFLQRTARSALRERGLATIKVRIFLGYGCVLT